MAKFGETTRKRRAKFADLPFPFRGEVAKGNLTMISYITLGADNLTLAERFYSSFLPRLGFVLEVSDEGLSYILPEIHENQPEAIDLYIKHPHKSLIQNSAAAFP
ncbi:MAG: hypothetical protein HC779_07965 [Phyllobacteriaceae bacterium]|nr:hypothetical protein [Phyllobacteriaceae bacterium]